MTAKAASTYAGKVGQAIRLLRSTLPKPLALEEMARAMDLSKSGWSRCETGDTVMTVEQLRRAAKVLGMKPSEILALVESLP